MNTISPSRPTIVTLTTDWGSRDFFVGRMKGRLLSYIPDAQIVDITHDIEPFQLQRAIFVARHACMEFPAETIHIIDVSTCADAEHPLLAVRHGGQYYLCADNQLPHALFGDPAGGGAAEGDGMAVIGGAEAAEGAGNFAACDLLCKAASLLAHGAQLSDLGPAPARLNRYTPYCNAVSGSRVVTHIAYIDGYGNAYLNLEYEEFERLRAGRGFAMRVWEHTLTRMCPRYCDDRRGGGRGLLLTVSSTGLLELAVYEGCAERLCNLKVMQQVAIEFR